LSYFKYNSSFLKDTALFNRIQDAWGTPDTESNPVQGWEAAWCCICPIMKAEKHRRCQYSLKVANQRLELAHLQTLLTLESNTEEKDYVFSLEKIMWALEHHKAALWRQCSRLYWLTVSEAPSRYFFAQLKAKHARDTITSLDVETDQPATSDADLVKAVKDHFTDQFTLDPAVPANTIELNQVLSSITPSIFNIKNTVLFSIPSNEKICTTVFGFKRDKSLGWS
jgi:hypothetical protein